MNRWIDRLFYLLIALFILSYGLFFFRSKPFFLDEWFLIYNFKFRTAREFFSGFLYSQQFPRFYLLVIQRLCEMFHFSEGSIRFFPFLAGSLSLVVAYPIARRAFKDLVSPLILLFALIILCNEVTLFYFNLIKQYTIDGLMALLAIHQFISLKEARPGGSSKVWQLSALGFIGCLLSTSYPITSAPLFAFLGISLWRDRSRRPIDLPVFAALLMGYLWSFFIDVRPGLSDPQMKIFWREALVDWSSWNGFFHHSTRSWAQLLCLPFFGQMNETRFRGIGALSDMLRILTMILTATGLIISIKDLFHKKELLWSRDAYFIGIFAMVAILYLLGAIPIGGSWGTNRINYFVVPTMSYFFIRALDAAWRSRHLPIRNVFAGVAMALVVLGFVKSLRSSIKEIRGQNSAFSRVLYDGMGEAIAKAYDLNMPILILNQALPYLPELAIRTHPAFDRSRPLLLKPVNRENEACLDPELTRSGRWILIRENGSYETLDSRKTCKSDSERVLTPASSPTPRAPDTSRPASIS